MKKCFVAVGLLLSCAGWIHATTVVVGEPLFRTSNSDFGRDPTQVVFRTVLAHIADAEGWKLRYVKGGVGDLEKCLLEERADLIYPISSQLRHPELTLTEEAVLSTWGVVFVNLETDIRSVLDLDGKTVVGLSGDGLIDQLRATVLQFSIDCEFVSAENYEQVLTAVENGLADAGIVERTAALRLHDRYEVHQSPVVLSPTTLHFAARSDQSDLIRTIDFHVSTLRHAPDSDYHRAVAAVLRPPEKTVTPMWIKVVLVSSGAIVAVFALVTFVLRRTVTDQSRELTEKNDLLSDEIRTRKGKEAEILRLATVVEQMVEGVIITDARGNIQYVNPAYERLTGRTLQQIAGTCALAPLDMDSRTRSTFSELRSAMRRHQSWRGRFPLPGNDKKARNVEATIVPIRQQIDPQLSFLAIVRDITRETALEDQLRQSQKLEALGTLAGGIAHDFNNSLCSMMGYTELAIMQLPDGAAQSELLEHVLQAGRRSSELIRQIMTFARRSDGEKLMIRVQTIVKETMQLIRSTIPAGIEIRSHLDAPQATVKCDPAQLQQILMNLCANAAHAMRERAGQIDVTLCEESSKLHESPDLVCITVRDNGHGMTPAVLERVFEPFYTTKPKGEGTGMGLAVVHGVVEAHGGTIEVSSTPGKGSTFRVVLPLQQEDVIEDVQETPSIIQGKGRILVVDDDPAVLNMLCQTLTNLGYDTVAAPNGQAALEIVDRDDAIDILLTDLAMPMLSGAELADQVVTIRPGMPVILLTGHRGALNDARATESGFQEILQKPISAHELADSVHRALTA